MLKPNSLRNALAEAVPALHGNPDMLSMSMTNGNILATLADSLSFEKQYTLNLAVTGFSGDWNELLVPIVAWLRENQPDIMTTDEGQKRGFTFASEIGSDGSILFRISLLLTERTLVNEVDSRLYAQDIGEPVPPPPVTRPVELYINGELVSRWDS